MINYNYNLGFKINRNNAYKELRTYLGLEVTYNNMLMHYVKINIPFTIPEGSDILRKDKKDGPAKVTIILYKSGNVTLSGVSFDINRRVYDRFNEIMAKSRELIEADTLNISQSRKREDTTSTEEEAEMRASEISLT